MYILGIDWNPNDTLFKLGPLLIKYYNLLWIAAFVLGFFLMRRIFRIENKPEDRLDTLFVYCVISIMLGARLGHVFFYDWAYYSEHLVEILLPIRENSGSTLFGLINGYEFTGFTGLASHGAAVAAIVGLYLFSRKYPDMSVLWLLDRIAITTAIGGAFVRIGNFFNSEINGNIIEDSSFLFATRFVRDSQDMPVIRAMKLTGKRNPNEAYQALTDDPAFSQVLAEIPYRHPVQMYEAFGYILVFLVMYYFLYLRTNRKNKEGYLFGFWMATVFTIRFILEYYKRGQGGLEEVLPWFSTGQWLSIPFVLIGLYFMFRPKPGTEI